MITISGVVNRTSNKSEERKLFLLPRSNCSFSFLVPDHRRRDSRVAEAAAASIVLVLPADENVMEELELILGGGFGFMASSFDLRWLSWIVTESGMIMWSEAPLLAGPVGRPSVGIVLQD
jgi:hypothetical protein